VRLIRCSALAAVGATAVAVAGLTAAAPALASPRAHSTFLGRFHGTKLIASTVPGDGDINPYGVAVIRHSQGRLHQGDILVSNFNNSKNLQGTGSTIVEVSPSGHRILFARISSAGLPGACPGGIGLTTALVVVRDWVIVGSLPSTSGQASTASAGCLLVVNSYGKVRETFSGHGINGPWDATAATHGPRAWLFVTNVLNGTVAAKGKVVHDGTVLRIGLRFHPGHLPAWRGVTTVPPGNGALFGLSLAPHGSGVYYVDDAANTLRLLS
jgi:hypothetical protein